MLMYPGFPGTDPKHPLGWFAWADQGQYLNQLKSLMNIGVSTLNEGVYPPGYIILAFPIAMFLQFFSDNYNEIAITVLNTILVISSVYIFMHAMNKNKAVLFLIMLLVLFCFLDSDIVRNSLIIPWSSSVTLFVSSLFYYIISVDGVMFKKRLNEMVIFILYGVMLSILLHTRPHDFVIISFASIIYLIFTFYRYNNIGLNVYLAFLSFALSEIGFYLLVDGLAFGSLYVETRHSFSISGNFDKLLGIIGGDQSYGIRSQSLLDRGVIAAVVIITVFIAGVAFSRVEIKIALILWFVIYLAFSDFGPHNFLVYELFHYIKTPFMLSLIVFINNITFNKLFLLSLLTFLLLSLSVFTKINFKNILYKTEKISVSENIWEISTNNNIEGIFVSGLLPKLKNNFLNILFSPPAVTINNVKLTAFKDYRVFVGDSGIYIHFFSKLPYFFRLAIDTKKLKQDSHLRLGIYSFNRSIGVK